MKILLKTYQEISETDFEELWNKAVFIFDANVILDLYRLPEDARKDLLKILENEILKTRIWLPFQAMLEFITNRLDAISDQKNKFYKVRSILEGSIKKIEEIHGELVKNLDDLQLKKRHSVINPDNHIDKDLFKDAIHKLSKFISELDKLEKEQVDVNDTDPLQKRVLKIFEKCVGLGFSKEKLDEIYKEGEQRYKDERPPGYKDTSKNGFVMFEDKKIVRKYGDLIIWKEIINKAVDENLEFIVMVTGDVKDDWWESKRGRKIGPRFELRNEIYFGAPSVKLFHMYDTANFMSHASKYLNIQVKEESINETKNLEKLVGTEDRFLQNYQKEFLSLLNEAYGSAYDLDEIKNSRMIEILRNIEESSAASVSPSDLSVLSVFKNFDEELSLVEIWRRFNSDMSRDELKNIVLKLVKNGYLERFYVDGKISGKRFARYKRPSLEN